MPCDRGHGSRLPGQLPLAPLWLEQHWQNHPANFSGKFKKQANNKPAFMVVALHWPGSGCLGFRTGQQGRNKENEKKPHPSLL